MDNRRYYEAYDDRYCQVHGADLSWFMEGPSPIVEQTLAAFGITGEAKLLEIGCGEGRDAVFLMERGYDLLATDVSREAVSYCRRKNPQISGRFRVLDCIRDCLDVRFDFIYAVAVIHMLVPDEDRNGFYRFIFHHLKPEGIGLICSMGDGEREYRSDISTAFELQERTVRQTGKTIRVAGTSCRTVSFETFGRELANNGLETVKMGITAVEPDFPQMMYAVVKRKG